MLKPLTNASPAVSPVSILKVVVFPAPFLNIPENAEAVDECLPRRDVRIARQHLKGGRLAGPVHAQQAETFGPAHAKGEPVDGHTVVLLHQVPHL